MTPPDFTWPYERIEAESGIVELALLDFAETVLTGGERAALQAKAFRLIEGIRLRSRPTR